MAEGAAEVRVFDGSWIKDVLGTSFLTEDVNLVQNGIADIHFALDVYR